MIVFHKNRGKLDEFIIAGLGRHKRNRPMIAPFALELLNVKNRQGTPSTQLTIRSQRMIQATVSTRGAERSSSPLHAFTNEKENLPHEAYAQDKTQKIPGDGQSTRVHECSHDQRAANFQGMTQGTWNQVEQKN